MAAAIRVPEHDEVDVDELRAILDALAALARHGVGAVLSGHVHDPFDKQVEIDGHQIRIVGAGTLSQRLRSSRPSFNRLVLDGAGGFAVEVKSL